MYPRGMLYKTSFLGYQSRSLDYTVYRDIDLGPAHIALLDSRLECRQLTKCRKEFIMEDSLNSVEKTYLYWLDPTLGSPRRKTVISSPK